MEARYNSTENFFDLVKEELIKLEFKLITSGKVRDIYTYRDKIILITTDRISAFDVVSDQHIPHKGQVLNMVAAHFLNHAKKDIICPTWLECTPNQNTSIGILCEPIKVEMVIRGYLTGSAWRAYKSGKKILSGVKMPEGMYENQFFPEPIITPTTKAEGGHDQEISREEIINSGLVKEAHYLVMEEITRNLFTRGTELAQENDLMLVDTKYEFGIHKDCVVLIDEVNTPDSSRYWKLGGHFARERRGDPPIQFSKEFLREWLMEKGYSGQHNIPFPYMPNEIISEVSRRYQELYEALTRTQFNPQNLSVDEFVISILLKL